MLRGVLVLSAIPGIPLFLLASGMEFWRVTVEGKAGLFAKGVEVEVCTGVGSACGSGYLAYVLGYPACGLGSK